eukprot:1138135-Pelagomonas_calceolata.AAC.7
MQIEGPSWAPAGAPAPSKPAAAAAAAAAVGAGAHVASGACGAAAVTVDAFGIPHPLLTGGHAAGAAGCSVAALGAGTASTAACIPHRLIHFTAAGGAVCVCVIQAPASKAACLWMMRTWRACSGFGCTQAKRDAFLFKCAAHTQVARTHWAL